ncbi:hypothetical protein EV714DRAFT_240388 [Schizophyllum commune]
MPCPMDTPSREKRYSLVGEILRAKPRRSVVRPLPDALPNWHDFIAGFLTPFAQWVGHWELSLIKTATIGWMIYFFLLPTKVRDGCDMVAWQVEQAMCMLPAPFTVMLPLGCDSTSAWDTQTTKLVAHNPVHPHRLPPYAMSSPSMDRIVGEDPLALEMVLIRHHIGRLVSQMPATLPNSEGALDLLARFSAELPSYSLAVHTALYQCRLHNAELSSVASSTLSALAGSSQELIVVPCRNLPGTALGTSIDFAALQSLASGLLEQVSLLETARDLGRSLMITLGQLATLLAQDEADNKMDAIALESQLWARLFARIGVQNPDLRKILASLAHLQSVDEVISGTGTAIHSIDVLLETQVIRQRQLYGLLNELGAADATCPSHLNMLLAASTHRWGPHVTKDTDRLYARLCADTLIRLKPAGDYRLTSLCLAHELHHDSEQTTIRLTTVAHDGQRHHSHVLAILIPYKKDYTLIDLNLSAGIYELTCDGPNEAWASGYYCDQAGEISVIAKEGGGMKTRQASRTNSLASMNKATQSNATARSKPPGKTTSKVPVRAKSTKASTTQKTKANNTTQASGPAKPVKRTRSLKSVPSAATLPDESTAVTATIVKAGKGVKSKSGQKVSYSCCISRGDSKGKEINVRERHFLTVVCKVADGIAQKSLILGAPNLKGLDAFLSPHLLGQKREAHTMLNVPYAVANASLCFGKGPAGVDVTVDTTAQLLGSMSTRPEFVRVSLTGHERGSPAPRTSFAYDPASQSR